MGLQCSWAPFMAHMTLVDSQGAIYEGRDDLNEAKREIAKLTNREGAAGSIHDAIEGADVFIGLSMAGVLDREDIGRMAKDSVVIAMANPVPEITPEAAIEAGAAFAADGRSVNNALAFPGLFKAALDIGAPAITSAMKIAAAEAISARAPDEELVPSPFDPDVHENVIAAVRAAASV